MTQTTKVAPSRTVPTSKDSLAGVRVAARELDRAISDAAAQRGQAITDQLPAKAAA